MLLGGLVSAAAVCWQVKGGLGGVVEEGQAAHKFSLGPPGWSWTQRSVPTILAYSVVHYIGKMISFQDSVQRYLSVPNQRVSLTETSPSQAEHQTRLGSLT